MRAEYYAPCIIFLQLKIKILIKGLFIIKSNVKNIVIIDKIPISFTKKGYLFHISPQWNRWSRNHKCKY